jgi:hypothetical protein
MAPMSLISIISFSVHLAVNGWLMMILLRNRVGRQLPWFTTYVASELVGAAIGLVLWSINRHLYVTVFWWMAAAQIILIVGAVRESFLRVFVGFRSLRWFPWCVGAVIACVVAYSGWKAIYVPAIETNRLISLIVDGEFAFRWTIVAVGLLSAGLERLFVLSRETRESAVLDGSTVASLGMLAWAVSTSLFGQKYSLITPYVPELVYLCAAAVWISHMSRPEIPAGFDRISITPEQAAAELSRYRKAAERFLKETLNKASLSTGR